MSYVVLKKWIDFAKEDENVVFVCADSIWYMLDRLDPTIKPWFRSNPDRMRRMVRCGIAEANALVIASGLAAKGLKVYFMDMGWLYERAYNMIVCSVCIDRYNVTMVGSSFGIGGGPTHQNSRDIATMSAIPNMIVLAPVDSVETEAAARFAYKYNGPVYIRTWYGSGPDKALLDKDHVFRLGKATIVREGNDVAIIGYQDWVFKAIQAAEQLAEDGIDARVINMSSIKPLDKNVIIQAAKETGAIVTVEETTIHGGLGSAVAGVVTENCPVPMKRIAIDDLFTQADISRRLGRPPMLEKYYHQTVDDLVQAVKATVKRKSR